MSSKKKRQHLSVDRLRPLEWRRSEDYIKNKDPDDIFSMLLNPKGETLAASLFYRGIEKAYRSTVDVRDSWNNLAGDSELKKVRELLNGDHDIRRAMPRDKYVSGRLPEKTYPAPLSQRDIVAEIDGIDLDAMHEAAISMQEEYEDIVIDPRFRRDEDDWMYSRSISINLPDGKSSALRFRINEDSDIYVIGGGTANVYDLFKYSVDTPRGKVFTEDGEPAKRLQLFQRYQELQGTT